ncbi:hypothetical protein BKA70DRAFT_1277706 [Coprinopsis sp. MPI-PUGE-AT-0042]|nr:hypothetical protein BKA70DRAFT_1277706 [Coprinopsis sp. MPI-PUGE-AT-0042]
MRARYNKAEIQALLGVTDTSTFTKFWDTCTEVADLYDLHARSDIQEGDDAVVNAIATITARQHDVVKHLSADARGKIIISALKLRCRYLTDLAKRQIEARRRSYMTDVPRRRAKRPSRRAGSEDKPYRPRESSSRGSRPRSLLGEKVGPPYGRAPISPAPPRQSAVASKTIAGRTTGEGDNDRTAVKTFLEAIEPPLGFLIDHFIEFGFKDSASILGVTKQPEESTMKIVERFQKFVAAKQGEVVTELQKMLLVEAFLTCKEV